MRSATYSILVVGFIAMVFALPVLSADKTSVKEDVSLSFDGRIIGVIEIENLHTRSYSDPYMMNKCVLPNDIEGVIWRFWLGGARVKTEELVVQNENNEQFMTVCWSSGSDSTKIMDREGKVIFEGPTSEFLFAGPDSSSRLRISFGKATTEIEMQYDE